LHALPEQKPVEHDLFFVMAGLVPAIHVYKSCPQKTLMPGTSPGTTIELKAAPTNTPTSEAEI
jgi:hypothetical protein